MTKVENKLQKSMTDIENFKERFETLVDSLPDVVYALCHEGKFVFVNHAVEKLGYAPDELIGRHFSEIMAPSTGESCSGSKVLKKFKGKKTGEKDAPRLFDERRTGKRKTSGLEVHLLIKERDGLKAGMKDALTEDTLLAEVISSGSYELSTKGEEPLFIGSVGVIKDIREKRKAEAVICCLKDKLTRKAAEARYFNILEISPDAIVSSGADGKITQWNNGAEILFGYKKEEALGKKVEMLIPELDRASHEEGIRSIVNGNEKQFVRRVSEKEALKKDGTTVPVELTLSAIRLNDALNFTAIIRDVSARKKAEQELMKSDSRYSRLIKSVSAYVYSSYLENGEVVTTEHGPGCESITGYSGDDYDNDSGLWYKMIHKEDRTMVFKHIEKIVAGLPVEPIEHRIVHKDGSIRWISNSTIQNFDDEGRLLSYDGLIEDISVRKAIEGNLKKNLETVERLNQLMAGRELRIAQLREENEYLKCRIEVFEKQVGNMNGDQ